MGDQSLQRRFSRLGELQTPGAGRPPPAGTDDSRGTRDWVSSNWAPVVWVDFAIFPPQSGWEGDGAQVLPLPGSTVPELPNILLITSSCRTDGQWAS